MCTMHSVWVCRTRLVSEVVDEVVAFSVNSILDVDVCVHHEEVFVCHPDNPNSIIDWTADA